jgi:predicted nucleic acid-binding protein
MDYVKVSYLDASALVKLVIDEGDHLNVRRHFNSTTNFAATSLCLGEALGVIKGKRFHKNPLITEEQYFAATKRLVMDASGGRIEVDDINLFTLQSLISVEALAKKHHLDLSDALQLATILHGRYSPFGPHSSSVLITADRKLAKAAELESIRVWNCILTEAPDW